MKTSQLTLPIYFVKRSVKSLCYMPLTSKNLFISSRSEDEPLINHKFWKEVAQYHTLEQLDDILNCQDHAIELTFVQYFRLEEDLKDHLVQHVLVKTWSRKDGPASCPMKGTVKGICSRLFDSKHLGEVWDTPEICVWYSSSAIAFQRDTESCFCG